MICHNHYRTYQSVNRFEVLHLRGVSRPKFDKHRNTEDEIAVTGCQYGLAFQQGELSVAASPPGCNGPCVDEIRGWNGWWSRRLEHRGGDPDSGLVNERASVHDRSARFETDEPCRSGG